MCEPSNFIPSPETNKSWVTESHPDIKSRICAHLCRHTQFLVTILLTTDQSIWLFSVVSWTLPEAGSGRVFTWVTWLVIVPMFYPKNNYCCYYCFVIHGRGFAHIMVCVEIRGQLWGEYLYKASWDWRQLISFAWELPSPSEPFHWPTLSKVDTSFSCPLTWMTKDS